jgi:hypothetical protein
MDKLTLLANQLNCDKGTIKPNDGGYNGPRLGYTPFYNKCYKNKSDDIFNMFEMGIGAGASMQLWTKYFPNCNLFAADIADWTHLKNDRVTTFICDQSSKSSLYELKNNLPPLKIIIDDGSHIVQHQQITLGVLFSLLEPEGHYWIEDLCTSDPIWQGKDLYGYSTTFEKGESTVEILESYMQTGFFKNPFLTDIENAYLTSNIKYCQIMDLAPTDYGWTKLCLLTHK